MLLSPKDVFHPWCWRRKCCEDVTVALKPPSHRPALTFVRSRGGEMSEFLCAAQKVVLWLKRAPLVDTEGRFALLLLCCCCFFLTFLLFAVLGESLTHHVELFIRSLRGWPINSIFSCTLICNSAFALELLNTRIRREAERAKQRANE